MRWIETVEPAPWKVAGFTLGPLTLGHCMLIERFGLTDLEDETALHFFLGICSRSYADAYEWLTTQSEKPQFHFKNFKAYRMECFSYLHENMALPQTMDSTEKGETVGTPFLQGLRRTAIQHLNYSPHLINDSKFGQLVWDVLSYKEAIGQTRIIDDYLAKQLAKLNELNAEI